MTTPVLEMVNIGGGYGAAEILRSFTLRVASGEAIALLGRNGAGKSAVLRAASALLPRRTGRVLLHGDDVSSLETWQLARRGIAYVHEERRVFQGLTVRENLRVAESAQRREASFGVEHVLRLFPELVPTLGQRGSSLSGGEQQMLAVARALLIEPDVLLLDEAAEGLSPRVVDRLAEAVLELRQRRQTVIVAEQNLRFVRRVVDRVLILDRGGVIGELPVADLRDDHPWIQRYLAT